ncbi:hypothetical protein [Rhodococcus sp. (in: high G+C Gram-positive bacteria)]|uniref:hypothetical protein n=1 Tax=Rhodococcus sp. TaxID=1831 RepID=UPI0025855B3B|nr:hypothetical protein [Rhodococcus sp. (in: high G+C Gram-positive bacteria)]
MTDEHVLILDGQGVPAASLDAIAVHEAARQLVLELIEVCDDQDAAAAALIRIADAEGPASPLVAGVALLALVSVLADVAERLRQATGSTADLAAVVRGEG